MANFLKKIFLLLITFFVIPVYAHSTCEEYTAGNWYPGSYSSQSLAVSDCQSCHDDAGFGIGDTIHLKAGSATWSNTLAITIGCKIIGAGIASTIITDNTTDSNEHMIEIPSLTGSLEISNITISGTPGANDYKGHIYSTATGQSIRIHDITFSTTNDKKSIQIDGTVSNVLIDNCTFGTGSRGITVYGNTAVWTSAAAYAPGTNAGVYVEDCTFNRSAGGPITACYMGGRLVFRHNIVNAGNGIDIHGAGSSQRSGLYIEIYDNTFNATANKSHCINMRGGSAIIFNNTFSTYFSIPMRLINYRTEYGCTPGPTAMHGDNTNRCENGTSNPFDGDDSPPDNGWPCKDQIGRGPDQGSYPSYEWNNQFSDSSNATFAVSSGWSCATAPNQSDHIQPSRDYYTAQHPTYVAYTYEHPLQGAGDSTPPVLSNLAPSAPLPAGTTSTNMTCDSDETCECKYDTSDVAFGSMGNTFTTTDAMSHSQTLTGLTNGSSTTYYIRCQDVNSNPMTSSDTITVSVESPGAQYVPTLGGCGCSGVSLN